MLITRKAYKMKEKKILLLRKYLRFKISRKGEEKN